MQDKKEISKAIQITKNDLKKFVHNHCLTKRRDLLGRIPNKLYQDAQIFIEGYFSAINNDIKLPIIQQDLKELLLEQGLKYIVSKFD